jgi:hypothetical protein
MLPFVRRRNQKINYSPANSHSSAAFTAATMSGVFKSQHLLSDLSGPYIRINGVSKES